MADDAPPRNRKELYERIARGGKDEVIVDEMVRLGFWPAAATLPDDPADELRRRSELVGRLVVLRDQATRLRNAAKLEQDARGQRLADARRKREETKQRRLAIRAARQLAWRERKTREIGYLGAGVSGGLGPPRPGGPVASPGPDLPVLHTAADLAAAMHITVGQLRFLAFAREVSTTTHYRRFTIPKRTGGERLISAPRARLKDAQRWILEHVLERIPLAEPAHGFVRGRSIVSNAVPHVGAAVVVNVDLKDFFPTVTYRRVKGLFRRLGYGEEIATLLGLLCTEPDVTETVLDGITYYVARSARHLPQGAPTSPAITNVMCRRLDRRLTGCATRHGFTYTRYADDLTLSSKDGAAPVGAVLAIIHKVAVGEGWTVHPDKVRVLRKGRRQEVTGVIVNERPGIARTTLRRFRALLHQIERDGPAGKRWGAAGDVFVSALGFVSYVAMVDPARGAALRAQVLTLRARHR